MSVPAVSSAVPSVIVPEVHKPASAPVASQPSAPVAPQPSAPSSPSDTVTLSSASPKASPAGDVDHDGDSH
jgi:hypothetical protein